MNKGKKNKNKNKNKNNSKTHSDPDANAAYLQSSPSMAAGAAKTAKTTSTAASTTTISPVAAVLANSPAREKLSSSSPSDSDVEIDVVGTQSPPNRKVASIKSTTATPDATTTGTSCSTKDFNDTGIPSRYCAKPPTYPTLPLATNQQRSDAHVAFSLNYDADNDNDNDTVDPTVTSSSIPTPVNLSLPTPDLQSSTNINFSIDSAVAAATTTTSPPRNEYPPAEDINSSTSQSANSDSNIADPSSLPSFSRPMPIIITEKYSFAKIIEGVKLALGHSDFTSKSTHRGCEIRCKDLASHKKLVAFLTSNGIAMYTHQSSDESSCKIFIRFLNKNTPTDWIKNELTNLGFIVKFVSAVKNRFTGEAYHGFIVHLEKVHNYQEVFAITKLGYQKVIIEAQRPQLSQCQRCQKFGHTKNYCSLSYKCVKCAGKHPTDKCTKSRNEIATCANCSDPHTASYKGCMTYQHARQNFLGNTQSNQDNNMQQHPTPALHPISISSDASGNRVPIETLTDTVSTLQKELLNLRKQISARQSSEQSFEHCFTPHSLSGCRPHSSLQTTALQLPSFSSEESSNWRRLRRIAREMLQIIEDIDITESSSQPSVSCTVLNIRLLSLIRDFLPLLIKLKVISGLECLN